MDMDGSGEVDFSEFVTATVNRNDLLKEEKLRKEKPRRFIDNFAARSSPFQQTNFLHLNKLQINK